MNNELKIRAINRIANGLVMMPGDMYSVRQLIEEGYKAGWNDALKELSLDEIEKISVELLAKQTRGMLLKAVDKLASEGQELSHNNGTGQLGKVQEVPQTLVPTKSD